VPIAPVTVRAVAVRPLPTDEPASWLAAEELLVLQLAARGYSCEQMLPLLQETGDAPEPLLARAAALLGVPGNTRRAIQRARLRRLIV
jgi:hypothetical protein